MEIINEKYSEYYYYLDDIWKIIHNLVIVFIAFFLVGFFASGTIFKLIIKAFNLQSATIVATSPFQFLDLAMTTGIYLGFAVCLPVFFYQMYKFMRGGLNHSEKNLFFVLVPIGLMLFIGGFLYGIVVLYFSLDSIASINLTLGIQNFWDISNFLSQVILTSTLLGIIFQFPIILTFLLKKRMFNVNFLKEKRRHAVVILLIITSLLPPTDGLSLVVMVLPLIIIYEAMILINSVYMSPTRFPLKAI